MVADHPDVVWAIDFQFDATSDGRPIKIANVIDELGRIATARGRWAVAIRCDNGPELISQALADECAGRVGLSLIDPVCLWQNSYVESFHGRLRDDCLNLNQFALLLEAKVVIDDWRAEYNVVRPHSALGYQPPDRYAAPTNIKTPSSQSLWTCRRGPVTSLAVELVPQHLPCPATAL